MTFNLNASMWLLALATACGSPAPSPAPAKQAPVSVPPPPTEPAPAPAPKPEPPPSAAGLQYMELVTGGAAKDAALPMIVAIHGLGDTPESFVSLLDGLGGEVRVILPRGLDPHGSGWSWFPLRARDEDVEALSTGLLSAADKIAAAIAELTDRRPTVGKPIVTGFSQGGMLTFAIAAHHPELVAAAFPVGGWLPPPLWPDSSPPDSPRIEALHGTDDPAVKFEPTSDSVKHLDKLGFDVTLRPFDGVRHAIPPEMRDQLHELLRAALTELSKGSPRKTG